MKVARQVNSERPRGERDSLTRSVRHPPIIVKTYGNASISIGFDGLWEDVRMRGVEERCEKVQATSHTSTNDHPQSSVQREKL